MLLKQTLRGRPKELAHVTARRHSSSPDSIQYKAKMHYNPPQDITLTHNSILCGFLFQQHARKESLNDRRCSKDTKTSLGDDLCFNKYPIVRFLVTY